MADLNQIYGVNYYFNAADNATQTIKKIQSSIDALDDSVKRSGSDLDNTFQRVRLGINDFTSKVESVEKSTSKFLDNPTENIGRFAAAVEDTVKAIKDCDKQLETLRELEKKVGAAGGDTSAIQQVIAQIENERKALEEAGSSLQEIRMTSLAKAYNSAGNEADREKIRLQALSDGINTLKMTSQEASELFQKALEGVADGSSSVEDFAQSVGDIKEKGDKAGATLKGLSKLLGSNSGLGKVLGTVAKGFTGIAGGIALMAAKFIGSQIKKKINELTKELLNAIKSIGEFKRALREGMGNATVDAQGELRKLDELNTKLKTAEKSSAEYNKARAEVISSYGKYNQYLDSEIKKVGDLSSVYDQLRHAIIEASVEKQRNKLIDETSDKYSDKLTKQSAKMLRKYQREFGKEEGLAAFQSWRDAQLMGTNMSEDAQRLSWMRASRRFSNISNRMNKRIDRINALMTPTQTDMSFDYTLSNQLYDEARDRAELIRKAKQYEVEITRDQDQLVVDAMRDGYSKQYAQANLNYQRRLDQMDDFKEQIIQKQMEMRKAEWEEHDEWSIVDKNGPLYQWWMSQATETANALLEKQMALEEKAHQMEMAEIAFQQRQSLASSYGTLSQQKAAAQERWGREDYSKVYGMSAEDFKKRAEAFHQYELAQMDYESIQKYGSQDQIREALEKMLDAEIKTLEDAEKPAAEARKKVTLAEFDADLAEKYAGRDAQRKALEDRLNGELEMIEDKYKEIKEASNKVALAEFDQETVDKYGSRSERRDALEKTLAARLEEFVKRNGEAQKAIIEAQNEYELANFDYEEIVDYGSYDQVLEKLRAKWQAFIKTLPEDLQKGATKKMQAEIYDLQRQHSGVYQQIFSNMDTMTREAIDRTIALAEEELRHLAETSGASADVIGELSNRIDELRAKRDQIDFGGWGGSISGILALNAERNRNRQRKEDLVAGQKELLQSDINARLSEDYLKLSNDIHEADEAEAKLTQDIQKQAAVIAASGIADMLSEIGGLLSDIAQVSGNTELAKFGQDMAEFGSSLSNVANGFAQGGLVGGIVAAAKETVNSIVAVVRSLVMGAKQWQKTMDDFSESVEKMKYALDSSKFENVFGSNAAGYASDAYAKATLALRDYKAASDELKNTMFKTQEDTKNPWWLKASPLTAIWSWYQTFFGKNKHQESFGSLDIWGEDGALDVEKAQAFLSVQTTLTDEQVEQIENAIRLKQAYDDATDAVEDYVASFVGNTVSDLAGEMLENFLETGDAVMDLTDNMDGFAQAIARSAIEARLLNEVFTEDMQQKMVDLIVSGNNAGAIDLYNQLLNQANSLAPSINEFLSGIGIKPREEEEEDRRARTRSSLGASQDSIDESNARLTAIQAHTYELNENVRLMREQNEELRLRTTEILAEVMGIHSDTTAAGMTLAEMMTYMKEMRLDISTIVDKGVTILA